MDKYERARFVEARVKNMTSDESEHFQELMFRLLHCYGKEASRAVIIFEEADSQIVHVSSANCNEMEASEMMYKAKEFFEYLNMRDAPPKEMFN